jgi:6-phosphogluconolactonase
MERLTRRAFLQTASAATLAVAAPALAKPVVASHRRQRVFVASGSKDGILAYNWEPATGELAPDGVAAPLANVAWITYSSAHENLFAASDVRAASTASPRASRGQLPRDEGRICNRSPTQNSAGAGTCHVALDHTGRVLLAADYTAAAARPAFW